MRVLWVGMLLAAAFAARAQGLPAAASPEAVGLSSATLQGVTNLIEEAVIEKRIPGAVVLIARHGQVAYARTFGYRDITTQSSMAIDSIFRIASMTKPIASLAAMMLVEEKKLGLDDPLSRYAQELTNLQVGIEHAGIDGKKVMALEPAKREATVRDLLLHTAGFTYGMFGNTLVDEMYRGAGLLGPHMTLPEMTAKLAKLPLANQPGQMWRYSVATNVLGRVVEAASGMPFDQFIDARIVKPLKMQDSGFVVPQANLGRVAETFPDPATGRPRSQWPVRTPPRGAMGGEGMVSTAADYLRFAQLFLNGGTLDGARLASPETVRLMTTQQLPPSVTKVRISSAASTGSLVDNGFGYGFGVYQGANDTPPRASPGTFYWGGAFGTDFFVDPKEQMVVILMTTVAGNGGLAGKIRPVIYQAIVN